MHRTRAGFGASQALLQHLSQCAKRSSQKSNLMSSEEGLIDFVRVQRLSDTGFATATTSREWRT